MNTGRTTVPLSTAHATYGEMVHTHTSKDRDRRNQPGDPADVLYSGRRARRDAPLSVPTSTINWWPYPPWGQSTVSLTPSVTTTASVSSSPVAVSSASAPASTTTTSSSEATSSPSSSPAPSSTVTSVTATPPATSLSSRPEVNATAHSSFNMLYLIPVFIVVGLLLGALSGLLGYRWYLRRLARKRGDSGGRWKGSFISGPPYIPMRDISRNAGGTEEPSSNLVGSPSKYTRHGARYATRAWLSSVTGAGSRRASTRSTVPLSSRDTIGAGASSHSRPTTTSHTLARSRGSTIPPTSPSDVENSRRDYARNTSIRHNLLERMQRGSDRSPRGVTRDPSRRTTQTYLSTASAYSGTYEGDSFSPSAAPSSAPNTEWEPGSGFRIIVEGNTTPRPPTATTTATDQSSASASASVSGLPGRTNAWDSGEALRQAVNTHPGERWLAWTRSWVSNPPPSGEEEDRFTTVPARRSNSHPKGADVLLRSPPQVTSSPLQSTLTFSPQPQPQPELPAHAITANGKKNNKRQAPQPQPQANHAAARGTSSASSIVPEGGGYGTPAMRYAARHTALSRVEEILVHSYSSRDLIPPDSPNAFGATPTLASLEDFGWAAGIEHRLAVASAASADKG
ncbi:hypothetical protein V8E52_010705 [Russula decolorans]